jgi:hypothetical protein
VYSTRSSPGGSSHLAAQKKTPGHQARRIILHSANLRPAERSPRSGQSNDCDQPAATGTRIHAAGRKRGSVASFCSWAAVTCGRGAAGRPSASRRRVILPRGRGGGKHFFSRPASGNPSQASHRRDDSVPREEPHVSFACVAFALKGPDISAQGKATRVVRASPSPWVAYHCGEKALKGRDNRCIGLCRPFRASGPIRHHYPGRRYTLPRADLSRPLQGTPPRPATFRTVAVSPFQSRSARTPNEPGDGEFGGAQIRSKPPTSGRERQANGVFSGAWVCPRTTRITRAARVTLISSQTLPPPRVHRFVQVSRWRGGCAWTDPIRCQRRRLIACSRDIGHSAPDRGLLRLAPAADGLPGDPAHGTSFPEF